MVQNSRYTKTKKRRYDFSLDRQVNCVRQCHILDSLIDKTIQVKESLIMTGTHSNIFCPYVCTAFNGNLSGPQKELLLFHWKLGISIYTQKLKQPNKSHESSGDCHEIPKVITDVFTLIQILMTTPLHQSCHLNAMCIKSTNHQLNPNQPTNKGSSWSK